MYSNRPVVETNKNTISYLTKNPERIPERFNPRGQTVFKLYQFCVCHCTWRIVWTNSWVSLLFHFEWIYPSIDQQSSQVDTEDMTPVSFKQCTQIRTDPWRLTVSDFDCYTVKKRFYSCFLRKLHHFEYEDTMSVLLHLVIKGILYTPCYPLRLTK
jgi:hypothetical protein